MAHILKIKLDDLQSDPRYLRVTDHSQYDPNIEVTNRVLKFVIPGIDDFRIIELPKSDSLTYTSKSLKISSIVEDLPDGLYDIVYSVCPNEKVFTRVSYFRTVQLENTLFRMLAGIMTTKTESDMDDVYKVFVQCILKIKSLKANTIDKWNVKKAYDLYADINRSLDQIKNILNLI